MNPKNLPSVSVEPTSLDATFVVGGQRISIIVSGEPKSVDVQTTTKDSPESTTSEDDIYLLLQGPAHIKPKKGTEEGVEVTFLDELGNPNPKSLLFTFNNDFDPPFNALKILSLQLIIECDKMKFEALKQSGELKDYFPKVYNEIVKTPDNMPFMNPPDPPFNQPQQPQ